MRKVRDVMEPNVFSLPMDMPLAAAADALADRDISGAPVCDPGGRVVGVLSKSDLVEVFSVTPRGRVTGDVMTPLALTIDPDDLLERAIKLMAFEGVHRLIVLSKDGALAGIVTSMDIVREGAGYARAAPRIMAVAPPERAR